MTRTTKVIIAAAAGFIAGILLAPKSGEETRRELREKARDAKGYAKRKAQFAKESAREVGNTFRKGADNVSGEAAEFAKSARTSAEKVKQEAITLGEEAKTRASRVVDETRRTTRHAQKDV